ncbi:unnamed protein product [Vitrella brassicaformis CCMP3155]|uniref:Uncharacterized protein n=2 Tax=Vitrella brassicaformis TaxID=1169539 RepID=A0A0G4FKT4_VITBC|nr:unnamed protein product [Vitrella brassicaformis CCMP3155]|eukprot:CEM14565.1 unnamed protein product [Vitrella brassicaformis CCMP3155]
MTDHPMDSILPLSERTVTPRRSRQSDSPFRTPHRRPPSSPEFFTPMSTIKVGPPRTSQRGSSADGDQSASHDSASGNGTVPSAPESPLEDAVSPLPNGVGATSPKSAGDDGHVSNGDFGSSASRRRSSKQPPVDDPVIDQVERDLGLDIGADGLPLAARRKSSIPPVIVVHEQARDTAAPPEADDEHYLTVRIPLPRDGAPQFFNLSEGHSPSSNPTPDSPHGDPCVLSRAAAALASVREEGEGENDYVQRGEDGRGDVEGVEGIMERGSSVEGQLSEMRTSMERMWNQMEAYKKANQSLRHSIHDLLQERNLLHKIVLQLHSDSPSTVSAPRRANTMPVTSSDDAAQPPLRSARSHEGPDLSPPISARVADLSGRINAEQGVGSGRVEDRDVFDALVEGSRQFMAASSSSDLEGIYRIAMGAAPQQQWLDIVSGPKPSRDKRVVFSSIGGYWRTVDMGSDTHPSPLPADGSVGPYGSGVYVVALEYKGSTPTPMHSGLWLSVRPPRRSLWRRLTGAAALEGPQLVATRKRLPSYNETFLLELHRDGTVRIRHRGTRVLVCRGGLTSVVQGPPDAAGPVCTNVDSDSAADVLSPHLHSLDLTREPSLQGIDPTHTHTNSRFQLIAAKDHLLAGATRLLNLLPSTPPSRRSPTLPGPSVSSTSAQTGTTTTVPTQTQQPSLSCDRWYAFGHLNMLAAVRWAGKVREREDEEDTEREAHTCTTGSDEMEWCAVHFGDVAYR